MTNPERTVILDLAAIEAARGPQPNDYFVCVTRREAATCAFAIAALLMRGVCPDRECPNCNRSRRLFWDLTNELGPVYQRELFAKLAVNAIETPRVPWEEVG